MSGSIAGGWRALPGLGSRDTTSRESREKSSKETPLLFGDSESHLTGGSNYGSTDSMVTTIPTTPLTPSPQYTGPRDTFDTGFTTPPPPPRPVHEFDFTDISARSVTLRPNQVLLFANGIHLRIKAFASYRSVRDAGFVSATLSFARKEIDVRVLAFAASANGYCEITETDKPLVRLNSAMGKLPIEMTLLPAAARGARDEKIERRPLSYWATLAPEIMLAFMAAFGRDS